MASSFDVLIIGSGPAGLSAAGRAAERGLSHAVLERAPHLADTIFAYQKRKLVMAEPSLVPQLGEIPFEVGPREQVLGDWQQFVERRGIDVRFRHEVKDLRRGGPGFVAMTDHGSFEARHVVVAIGTQGNPRKLGIPGEELPHVADRLVDPDTHEDEDIVVIGAGDSAIEVALALCRRNRVHLVVRSAEIVRAKENLEREALGKQQSGEMRIHFSTTVRGIGDDWIDLNGPQGEVRVDANRVIKKIGADAPRKLLESWGIAFDGPGRDARPSLGDGYQSTSQPGLYLVGAVTGRDLIRLGINQGYEAVEHLCGEPVEPADEGVLRERLPFWTGSVRERIEEIRDALPVFGQATNDQLREIFLLARPLRLQDGEVLIRENDYTDSFLAVCGGRLQILRRAEGHREDELGRPVAQLTPGSFLGEMGLISGRRRSATAVSVGESWILEVPRKAMLKLLRLAPGSKRVIDSFFLLRALGNVLGTGLDESSERDLWRLAGRSKLVELDRDEVLFAEGSPSDALYLLRSGMLKLTKTSGEKEIVLTYLVAGNFFGESALLDDSPRTATVTTIFPSEIVVLERSDFLGFLESHPEVRMRLLEDLSERRIESLRSEATPGVGEVLSQLIESEAVMGTDVLLIDNHKCVRCGNCIAACEGVHPDRQARLSLTGDHVANLLLPNSCMQCENPLCMLDCPPDAIFRRPGGEIFIRDSCIGCGNCSVNCPYDNIFMVQPKPSGSFVDRLLGLVGLGGSAKNAGTSDVKQELAVKCDLCRDVRGGPACVRSCPTGAAIRIDAETPDELRRSVEVLVDPGALL